MVQRCDVRTRFDLGRPLVSCAILLTCSHVTLSRPVRDDHHTFIMIDQEIADVPTHTKMEVEPITQEPDATLTPAVVAPTSSPPSTYLALTPVIFGIHWVGVLGLLLVLLPLANDMLKPHFYSSRCARANSCRVLDQTRLALNKTEAVYAPFPPPFTLQQCNSSAADTEDEWCPFMSEDDSKRLHEVWREELESLVDVFVDKPGEGEDITHALMAFLRFSPEHLHFTDLEGRSLVQATSGLEWLQRTRRTILIIEGRSNFPFLIFTIRHLLRMLIPGQSPNDNPDTRWSMMLFHSPENAEWLMDSLDIRPGGWGEHIEMHRVEGLSFKQANTLPTSMAFLDSIPKHIEYFLLYQADSIMLRSTHLAAPSTTRAPVDLDELMDSGFVYLGAPWRLGGGEGHEYQLYGGNGGTSLRRRQAMMDLLTELTCELFYCRRVGMYAQQRWNPKVRDNLRNPSRQEDVFIAQQLHAHIEHYDGQWAPEPSVLAQFSIERLEFDALPWFGHAIWKTLPRERALAHLVQLKQFYPYLWRG